MRSRWPRRDTREQIQPFQQFVLKKREWHVSRSTACPERRSSRQWSLRRGMAVASRPPIGGGRLVHKCQYLTRPNDLRQPAASSWSTGPGTFDTLWRCLSSPLPRLGGWFALCAPPRLLTRLDGVSAPTVFQGEPVRIVRARQIVDRVSTLMGSYPPHRRRPAR